MFYGESVHAVLETVTLPSRAIAIEVTVVMFRLPSGRGCNRFTRI